MATLILCALRIVIACLILRKPTYTQNIKLYDNVHFIYVTYCNYLFNQKTYVPVWGTAVACQQKINN